MKTPTHLDKFVMLISWIVAALSVSTTIGIWRLLPLADTPVTHTLTIVWGVWMIIVSGWSCYCAYTATKRYW